MRPDASVPERHQSIAGRRHHGRRVRRDLVQDVSAFKVSVLGHVEGGGDRRRVVGAQREPQLLWRPEIEPAFLAFAIRIKAGKESAVGRGHLAQDESERFFGHPPE